MSSDTKILYSEGEPMLCHWDNGIVITYKLETEEHDAIEKVITGKSNREDALGVNVLRSDSIVHVIISGQNTNIEFGISENVAKDMGFLK
jgi:hypothetical protein